MLIGWFLTSAAEATQRQAAGTRQLLHGVMMEHLTVREAVFISPGASIHDLIMNYFLGRNRRAVLVRQDGDLQGIITRSHVIRYLQTAQELGLAVRTEDSHARE